MLPITASNPFKWRHYPAEIILWCVRWYLRYPISFIHMSEMAGGAWAAIDASCIWRWVQMYGPELDKRCRRHLKPTNRSWRPDETYSALSSVLLRTVKVPLVLGWPYLRDGHFLVSTTCRVLCRSAPVPAIRP